MEVGVADALVRLGQLDETRNIHDVETGRAGLRTAMEMGLFALERETRFTFMTYFDSVDAWLAYMAQPSCGAVASPEVVARARAALPAGAEGNVRMRRVIYAGRLRRLGAV